MAQANLLFRQVHPNHIDDGEPSSIAFRPGSGDGDRLSVDCSNMTNEEYAYNLHLRKGLRSGGTWAVSRTICEQEELPVIPDPVINILNQPDNFAHHLIDFAPVRDNPEKSIRAVSKRLRHDAVARGKLWPI